MDTYLDPAPFMTGMAEMDLSETAALAHIQAISWIYDREIESCIIPSHEVRRLFFVKDHGAVVAQLVEAGAWAAVPGGYVVLHHQEFIQRRLRAQAGVRRRNRSASRAARTPAYQEIKAAIRRGECECASCGTRDRLQVDHIIPRSRGGSEDVDNLQVLCLSCNSSKNATDWAEWQRANARRD